MKRITFILFLLTSLPLLGQDFNQNLDCPADKVEVLVGLAMDNNPTNQILASSERIAELELTQARWSWLNNVRASGNLNEISLRSGGEDGNFFPRYNFSMTLPLGQFLQTSGQTKIARERIQITQAQISQSRIDIRQSVATAYNNYCLANNLLDIQTRITSNELSDYEITLDKFTNNEIPLEDLHRAENDFQNQLSRKVQIEIQLRNSIQNLIQLAGETVPTVLNQ